MYNIGIVGLGHVARHQISALERSGKFRLIAGCDTDASCFELLSADVQSFTEIDEMLGLPGLDVVVVASPNRLHVDHGIRVMEAGKWLVMEKPLAETQEELERFSARRQALGGKCTLALHAAHGVEVEWFCREYASTGRFGDVVAFDARFYDPYFENGLLTSSARSLGGSWIDSGINALSVICRMVDAAALEITDSRMTRVAGTDCHEVQGTVEFRIAGPQGGTGSIDTNWTLGRNSKSTRIAFSDDDGRYVFDHSGQEVIRYQDGQPEVVFTCTNGLPRLTNHYIGVFDEVARQIQEDSHNFEYCLELHRLLYQAERSVL
jgi:D-galactose 1-dehydrogenase